jgi:hypothetical protein
MKTGAGDALRKCEEAGRALLQMKPIDRTVYAAWSEGARELVGKLLGADSAAFKEFLQARRSISVRFESDPSYHLTQLGANLRRELDVLRSRIVLAEGVTSVGARSPLRTASSGSSVAPMDGRAAPEARPARSRAATPATSPPASREDGGLFLLSFSGEPVERRTLDALASWDVKRLSQEKLFGVRRGDGALLSGVRAGTRVILLVGAGPRERAAARALDLAFAAGFLLGTLGRDRVCLLLEEGAEAPPADWGISSVSLDDPDGWRPKVLQCLSADRVAEPRAAGA